MPDASQIVAGLTAVANESQRIAVGWHALLGAAIVALLLLLLQKCSETPLLQLVAHTLVVLRRSS